MKIQPAFFAAALLALPAGAAGQQPEPQRQREVKDQAHKEAEELINGKTQWPEDAGRAQEKASGLAIQLILKDPARAATLWASFLVHVEQGQTAAGAPDPVALEQLHQSLMQDLAETAVTFPALMQFLAKVDRDPVSENFGTWETSLGSAFSERFESFPQVMAEEPEQHIFQTTGLRKLVRFFQATAKDTPEEARPTLAAYAVYQFFADYGYQEYWNDRHAAVEWADSTLKPLHPLLADAMVIAILTSDHGRLDKDQANELRARTLRLANATELAPVEKASALAQAIEPSSHEKYDRPETVKAVAKAVTDFVSPKRDLAAPKTLRLLTELTEYQNLSKEDATGLSAKLASSRLGAGSTKLPPGETRELISRLRLNLALRSGNAEEIAAVVKAAGSEIHGRLEIAIKLWQAGQGGIAASLIAGPDEFVVKAANYFLDGAPKYFVPPTFTRETETQLPVWLESIPDREQRFRVECVISSLVDAREAGPKENREARVARLIGRFAAEGPKAKAARMETLAALSLSLEKGILLREDMDQMVGDVDMGSLMSWKSKSSLSQDGKAVAEVLVRRGIRYRLETDGDAAYFLKQVKSISAVRSGTMSGWDMRQDLYSFYTFYAALLCRKIVEVPPERVPALLEQARQICESFLGCGERYAQQSAPGLAIMAHAAGNAGAALDAWHDQLAPELKEAYDYARGRYGLPNNLRVTRAYPLLNPAMTPQRRVILKRFLCDAATVARELHTPSEISYLLDFEVFNKDDLFAVLDELPKDHPWRAKFFAEKAAQQGHRFQDPEGAAQTYEAAAAMAKESGNPRDLPYVIVSKARFLTDDLHHADEAAALLKDIDLSLLDEREKDWVTEFQAKQKH